jgi:ribulose 1,5-bisphosphate synthetase/thiazole synthase
MNDVAEPVTMPRDGIDVVVVGAGPTDLMLAGDLAEAGVRSPCSNGGAPGPT